MVRNKTVNLTNKWIIDGVMMMSFITKEETVTIHV